MSTSDIISENFAPNQWLTWPRRSVRVVDWNIDRGLRLSEIIEFLGDSDADVYLLQEVDINAYRTHQLNIAEEIARKLRLNYVFGREFVELTQGSKTSPAYHGQATLSRWRMSNRRLIRFQQQSDFWKPRWFKPKLQTFQERLGGRIALVSEIADRFRFGRPKTDSNSSSLRKAQNSFHLSLQYLFLLVDLRIAKHNSANNYRAVQITERMEQGRRSFLLVFE